MARRKKEVSQEGDVRRAILSAATKLFAKGGYDGTGVQEITDAAHVNKAMLYYYFKSKEELYDCLIGHGIGEVGHAVATAEEPGLTLEKRLRRFLGSYLSAVLEKPELAIMICREVVGVSSSRRKQVVAYVSDTIQRLATLLDESKDANEVRQVDSAFVAFGLFGIVTMFISRHLLTQEELEVEPLIDRIVDLFLQGVGVANLHARENLS